MVPLLSWVKVVLLKEGRCKEFGQGDSEALADLMEDPQLYGIVGAGQQIAQGGFGNTAFDEQLVLGHILLGQKLFDPQTYRLIQLHFHPTSLLR